MIEPGDRTSKCVQIDAVQQSVEVLQECGGDVQFTAYPEAGHDIGALVYEKPDPVFLAVASNVKVIFGPSYFKLERSL